jgi:hypothetical protein
MVLVFVKQLVHEILLHHPFHHQQGCIQLLQVLVWGKL